MSFYEGQTVVVTGGAGMIGYQLVQLLLEAGAEVIVLDDLSRGRNNATDAAYVTGNAANRNTCRYTFNCLRLRGDTPVFAVFNLAAYVAGVKHNISHNLEMFNQNVLLQTIPIEIAEEVGVPHFLQTSSVCVYSDATQSQTYMQEVRGLAEEPNPANGGYAWSKRMGEVMLKLSSIEHAVIVRPTNAYGPNDYFDDRSHVIPALIERAIKYDALHVHGSPHVIRDFIHCRDVAAGMMHVMEHGIHMRPFNLATGYPVTMRYLAETIISLAAPGKEAFFNHDGKDGDLERTPSTQNAELIGWQSSISLEDGLRETIEWYKTTKLN